MEILSMSRVTVLGALLKQKFVTFECKQTNQIAGYISSTHAKYHVTLYFNISCNVLTYVHIQWQRLKLMTMFFYIICTCWQLHVPTIQRFYRLIAYYRYTLVKDI